MPRLEGMRSLSGGAAAGTTASGSPRLRRIGCGGKGGGVRRSCGRVPLRAASDLTWSSITFAGVAAGAAASTRHTSAQQLAQCRRARTAAHAGKLSSVPSRCRRARKSRAGVWCASPGVAAGRCYLAAGEEDLWIRKQCGSAEQSDETNRRCACKRPAPGCRQHERRQRPDSSHAVSQQTCRQSKQPVCFHACW